MSDQFPLISVNGIQGANVSPMDRGFTYGDGLFETCRVIAGRIPLWKYHQDRLVRGCQRLLIPLDFSQLECYLTELLTTAVDRNLVQGVLKVTVTRGVGGRGYNLPETTLPTICIAIFPANTVTRFPENPGISLRVCQQRLSASPRLAGLKHLNRLEHILARAEWRGNSFDDGLLLNERHQVIETISSNIFMVRDRTLITPDLSQSGVEGVARRVIIEELAATLDLVSVVREFSVEELANADEIFICNSVKGVQPVRLLASESSVVFPQGAQTLALQRTFEKFVENAGVAARVGAGI